MSPQYNSVDVHCSFNVGPCASFLKIIILFAWSDEKSFFSMTTRQKYSHFGEGSFDYKSVSISPIKLQFFFPLIEKMFFEKFSSQFSDMKCELTARSYCIQMSYFLPFLIDFHFQTLAAQRRKIRL